MNTIFHMVPLLLPLIAVLATPGCGKGTATHSVTGVITNISTNTYNGKVTLTFKDDTEVKLKNGQKHAIFKNVPVRIDYDSGRCITGVVRLVPVDENSTIVSTIKPGEDKSDTDILNRPLIIQMNNRPDGTWGIGSTMQEVKAIEGEPQSVSTHSFRNQEIRWYYGPGTYCHVEFSLIGSTMRVAKYVNDGDKFKFKKVSAIPVRIIKEKD